MAKEFDHVAAIIDDRRRAIRFLKRAISELELAECNEIRARLETAYRDLVEMTPGGQKPRRRYTAGNRSAGARDLDRAAAFASRLSGAIQGH